MPEPTTRADVLAARGFTPEPGPLFADCARLCTCTGCGAAVLNMPEGRRRHLETVHPTVHAALLHATQKGGDRRHA